MKKMYRYTNGGSDSEYSSRKGTGKRIVALILSAIAFGAIAACTFVTVKHIAEPSAQKTTETEMLPAETTAVNAVANDITAAEQNEKMQESTDETDIPAVVEAAMPSIVSITNTQIYQNYHSYGYFFPGFESAGTYEVQGFGSGVIFKETDEVYYIVTNFHVIEGASAITAELSDGTTADAAVAGYDAANDLAVISIAKSSLSDETKNTVKPVPMGNSDSVRVGEKVIAIGNALGYGQSVTTGIISALGREVTAQNNDGSIYTRTLMQTDAAINPGNSGGALLNMSGELIGINSMKASDTTVEGIGYAIPVKTFSALIEELMTQQQNTAEKSEEQQKTQENGGMEERQYSESEIEKLFEYFFNNPQRR